MGFLVKCDVRDDIRRNNTTASPIYDSSSGYAHCAAACLPYGVGGEVNMSRNKRAGMSIEMQVRSRT